MSRAWSSAKAARLLAEGEEGMAEGMAVVMVVKAQSLVVVVLPTRTTLRTEVFLSEHCKSTALSRSAVPLWL